jgi:hypothetical protein
MLAAGVVHAARYAPLLPKTPQAKKVIVVDMKDDLAETVLVERWDFAKEALAVSTVIQGIVNRTSTTKLYFIHTPQEHNRKAYPADLWQLEDGMIPVPRVNAVLPAGKKFPGLSYVLANYRKYVKGKVIYPGIASNVCDGAVAAAITVAGIKDAIPVSDRIDEYIKKDGFDFPVVEKIEFKSNIEAFDWALKNYLRPETTRKFIGHHSATSFGGDQVPIFWDYFVANRAFVFCLNGNRPAEKAKIGDLLNSRNYPPGSPVLGIPVDEGAGLREIQQQGYYFEITQIPNTSVTSSFPSDPRRLTPPPPPEALKFDPQGVYVTFFVTDGDSLGPCTSYHYNNIRNLPHAGKVPIGWTTGQQLFDLFPTFLEWMSRKYRGVYEMVGDFNDGVSPYTEDGIKGYTARIRHYTHNTNGVLKVVNYFNYDPERGAARSDRIAEDVQPYFVIEGYNGPMGGKAGVFRIAGGVPITDLNGGRRSPGAQPGTPAPRPGDRVRGLVASMPPAEPVFVVQEAGAGWVGDDVPAAVLKMKDDLLADSSGRNYYFVTPTQLAATWRAYKGLPVQTDTGTPPKKTKGLK